MVICLSDAVDLVDKRVAKHHKTVAILGRSIATEMGLDSESVSNVLYAGLLHDIGALTLKERLDLLIFDDAPSDIHSERGYRLLSLFSPFSRIAEIVRYHHIPWVRTHPEVSIESHILHLADRVSVQIKNPGEVLSQADAIRSTIGRYTPRRFAPEAVEAFMTASLSDEFWLDTVTLDIDARISKLVEPGNIELDNDSVSELASLFGTVVDFRSRFTSVHAAGVAMVASILAGLFGMDDESLWKMRVAGNLHDIGKLAVPVEIIEKPGTLSSEEIAVMKRHTFYTHFLLSRLPEIREINDWASLHHERLDGKGYPFHKGADQLSVGSRIMSVADVFTALTENRPYRPGMDPEMAMRVMDWMADTGALDHDILDKLRTSIRTVDKQRMLAQQKARRLYQDFRMTSAKAA